jgi:nucleoid-associated protein YgaU
MGKLEKVIVLSVLALIAVILVISLSLDDPLKKEKAVWAGTPPGKPAAAEAAAALAAKDAGAKPAPAAHLAAAAKPEAAKPQGGAQVALASDAHPGDGSSDKPAAAVPSALLSTNVAAGQAEVAPAIPSGSVLVTADGLQDSYTPDLRFYTWQSGDSFRSVAAKYYGDAAKFTLLRRTNEGRENVQAGEKILVPVFDLDGGHSAPSAAAPASSVVAAPKPDSPAKTDAALKIAAAKAADASPGPRVHVVKDGESLWKIAKLELGDGGRWNEIYEANRDVLSKPEAVHTGLKLRIPVK